MPLSGAHRPTSAKTAEPQIVTVKQTGDKTHPVSPGMTWPTYKPSVAGIARPHVTITTGLP